MVVHTNSPKAREARRTNVQLLLSQHDSRCTSCVRSGNCNLQTIANDLGIFYLPYEQHLAREGWDFDFPIIRDNDKCIKCMRCIKVCGERAGLRGLGPDQPRHAYRRGHPRACADRQDRLRRVRSCSSRIARRAPCASVTIPRPCSTPSPIPTRSYWCRLRRPCVAPGARSSAFRARRPPLSAWLAPCAAFVGFQYVFDTDFSADLAVVEEGSELLSASGSRRAGLPAGPCSRAAARAGYAL